MKLRNHGVHVPVPVYKAIGSLVVSEKLSLVGKASSFLAKR